MKKSTRRERAAAHRAKSDKPEPRERPAKRGRRDRTPSGNAILARNLVIIAGLILAIAFTWKKYKRTLATREAERQLVTAQQRDSVSPTPPVEVPEEDPFAATAPGPNLATAPDLVPVPEPEPAPHPEPAPPVEPPSPQDTLTPAQSLIRLRAELAAGKRDTMPIGTLRRGESDFFLVTTPMTWMQANGFADAYGGHLPLVANADDLGWLSSHLAATAPSGHARSSLWVGARVQAGQWHGVDGSPLAHPPASEGSFAAIAADGTLQARGEADLHPFFIQWQRDGSNPSTLRAILARTKASLESPAPFYPPGTLSDGERRILVVSRATNAKDARELAAIGGGSLMVPATPSEAAWIDQNVTGAAYPNGLWLGAELRDAEWTWDTGEAWTFARWDPASPPGDGTALLLMPGAGWQAADPGREASGFLIEWSRAPATPATDSPSESADALLDKSRNLLAAAAKQRDAELAANSRSFTFNLDAWLRTNNKSEIARWKPQLEALKARVTANRVPADLPKRPNHAFSERMLSIASGCLEKQRFIDADFLIKAGRIRDAYTARMLELATTEEKRGQPVLARRLKDTAEAAAGLEDWLVGLGPLSGE